VLKPATPNAALTTDTVTQSGAITAPNNIEQGATLE
jgi:hypothetical protein